MVGYTFLGVFSGKAPSKKASPIGEPALWNVYLKNGEKIYLIQKLNEDNTISKEQYQITPIFFGINFRKVQNPNTKIEVKNDIEKIADKAVDESIFSSFFKNNSAFNSIFNHEQKTNEYAINVSEDKSYKAKQIAVKQHQPTKEFNINLNSSISPKNATIENNAKENSSEDNFTNQIVELEKPVAQKNNTQKSTIQNSNKEQAKTLSEGHKESDQHPFDEKYSPERFGLETILRNVELAQEKAKNKKLLPIRNNLGLSAKPLASEVLLVQPESEANSPIMPLSATEENVLLKAKGNSSPKSLSEKARKLDESLRAEFNISLSHWNMGKKNLAMRQFHAIINKESSFVPAHKHMFTDFAIQLRKINQHDLALASAIKCTKLSPDDSHAFFNVARLYYELSKYEMAEKFIQQTLQLENDLEPAIKLHAVIKECLRRKSINR